MDIKELIISKKFSPNALKDQFFLIDERAVADLIKFGDLSKNDKVLEIGAGFGNITKEIAIYAKSVIAYEIDKRYKPFTKDLPQNVDLRFEDAWKYIKQLKSGKQEFNKIISSLPYSFCEKLMHELIDIDYSKAVLVVPFKFVNTINENGVFSSFFKAEILSIIDKISFYPVPRTNSAIINLIKLEDPIKSKNLSLFLRQYVYKHQGQKIKNSLMEGLIVFTKLTENKILTKNESRKLIDDLSLPFEIFEKPIFNNNCYKTIEEKLINFPNF